MADMTGDENRREYYIVRLGKLVAGNYPHAWDQNELRIRIRDLLVQGVRCFVDLTEEGEAEPYDELLKNEAIAFQQITEHHRVSIPDNDVPTNEQMKAILDVIDNKIESGRVVYIHCLFGVGRTGTVVGCYLVRHGLSGAEALSEITRLHKGTHFEGMSSPVSRKQRDMVEHWIEGE